MPPGLDKECEASTLQMCHPMHNENHNLLNIVVIHKTTLSFYIVENIIIICYINYMDYQPLIRSFKKNHDLYKEWVGSIDILLMFYLRGNIINSIVKVRRPSDT